MVRTARGNKRTQSLVRLCFIWTLSFWVGSVSAGHTCGYLDVQSAQHWLVSPGITLDAYIFIRVHLFRGSVGFQSLFHQNFHSLFPCDLFAAGERPAETTRTTGDNKTVVVTTKPRQTVDEIHIQQRVSTVGNRQIRDQSPVTRVALFDGMTPTRVHYGLHSRP